MKPKINPSSLDLTKVYRDELALKSVRLKHHLRFRCENKPEPKH